MKITLLGMSAVFAFLTLMVACLYAMGKIFKSNKVEVPTTVDQDNNVPAAIAAAIARYRKGRKK